ncbi:MAG: alpha/beta fold hydrolase [Candidatus Saccharibacteria bacterium]|nr:alpha/beta fold hydrolase [Candidatus Saccharibacteria bacterium]
MKPDQYTIEERTVAVGDGHELYTQAWGNPNAKQTFIFLHGGPGSGCSDSSKTIFDPQKHRVIFFDQRGCGKSTPYGSIKNNTTNDLINDLATIADEYGVKTFVLFGRSWGACLALAFALKHPTRVTQMIIGGVFTGSQSEIDHMEKGRFAIFFPEVWDQYVATVPRSYQDNPSEYHFKRMFGDDVTAAQESAMAHSQLELSVLRLDDRVTDVDSLKFDPLPNIIESHYLANGCFMPDNHILDNANKLTMPIYIVQGRYDMVCPPINAYRLSQQAPNATLLWTAAGHDSKDRSNWETARALLATIS